MWLGSARVRAPKVPFVLFLPPTSFFCLSDFSIRCTSNQKLFRSLHIPLLFWFLRVVLVLHFLLCVCVFLPI